MHCTGSYQKQSRISIYASLFFPIRELSAMTLVSVFLCHFLATASEHLEL